jgi:multidrug efflux pump subunit AcrA (membrane-fusion protein)
MNRFALCPLAFALLSTAFAVDPARVANTVVLDDTGVNNLRIETIDVEETDFEESIFSLGRIEAIPASRSGVSSRIAGRIVELKAALGDVVAAGQEVARLESRQPGDPPPSIMLKAAAGGIVTKGNVALGEPLEPEATLMEITDLSEVFAIARVPEPQAGSMKPGTVAHIRVASLPEESFEGELLRFGTEADRESGTIDAIFKLPNPNLTIRPGMRAEFSIVLSKREGVMSIPRSALQGDAASRFVYVKDFDLKNAFIKTLVEVGQVNDRFAEITNGLLPGDSVVTRGGYSLAFAGGGSVSLKAALDAAHGHEHNEDGSELSPEQKKSQDGAIDEDGHAHADAWGGSTLWKIVSGVLAALLVITVARGRKSGGTSEDEESSATAKKSNPEAV